MSQVTLKDLESQCVYLTGRYLKNKPNLQFAIVSKPSGYWLTLYDFDGCFERDISSIGVTKKELHYYIRMFESGLEFKS